MNARFLLLFAAAALLFARFTQAVDSPAEPDLLPGLIDNALHLAEADEPLQRAHLCQNLAKLLTREMQREPEAARTARLSQMLEMVLVEGVAANLYEARKSIPADSRRLDQIRQMSEQTARVAEEAGKSLEARDPDNPQEMQERRQDLANAQNEVHNQSLGKAPKRPPGWLKKGKKK